MRSWWMFLLVACAPPEEPPVDDDAALTWHRDIRPIFDRHCSGCHTDGGIAPFSVAHDDGDWADGPAAWASLAALSVADGTMPPWSPADDCHDLQDSRAMGQGARDKVAAWADDDFPEGDPADYQPGRRSEPPDLGPPSLELRAADAYTADPAKPDDYRCFPLDSGLDDEAWISAFTVVPDQLDMVHHVILYRLEPRWADDVALWDEDEPGAGYSCFGSPGGGGTSVWEAEAIAGWAPGSNPEVYAEDSARRLPAGSVLVLQVHYNTLNVPVGASPPSDHTAVQLWLADERPVFELQALPFAETDLLLPAGDPDVEQTFDVELDWLLRTVPIRGVFPHMHQLGRTIRLDVVREDGTEDCLIHVPDWDFDWQQAYFFEPDDPVRVNRRDTLRITCTYDNSPANQPVVNGEQLEPRDVGWGDGSLDEMCLTYVYLTLPVGN